MTLFDLIALGCFAGAFLLLIVAAYLTYGPQALLAGAVSLALLGVFFIRRQAE